MNPLKNLNNIIKLFNNISENEKIYLLINYADKYLLYTPLPKEKFDLEDIRKDQECYDEITILLKVNKQQKINLKFKLKSEVQTFTKAIITIFCEAFNNCYIYDILKINDNILNKIIGKDLFRLRTQNLYYILKRIKNICKIYLIKINS